MAAAAAAAVTGDAAPGIYELGGPEVETLPRADASACSRIIRRRRLVVALPPGLARMQAGAPRLRRSAAASGCSPTPSLTRDQVQLLGHDNVVAPGARGFAELGIPPTAMEAVLESYLYAYRPHGQYDAIQESAARIRT